MKKITVCVMAMALSLTLHPIQSEAKTVAKTTTSAIATPLEQAEANSLVLRVNEINAMDMSKLNSSEKKSLRKEVRSIQQRLYSPGGVYISAGALIIIILLLIILL